MRSFGQSLKKIAGSLTVPLWAFGVWRPGGFDPTATGGVRADREGNAAPTVRSPDRLSPIRHKPFFVEDSPSVRS